MQVTSRPSGSPSKPLGQVSFVFLTGGRLGMNACTLPSMSDESVFIHPTAIVDDGASLGAGTKIWHFCHVQSGAVMGKNCVLGQNGYVANVKMGDGVRIQNNVSIYDRVELEDHVFCGPSSVFTNVINPRSQVNRKDEYKRTLVKRGASIGANATIVCGVTIGEYAFIGAGAVVASDVPAYALMVGVPAKRINWMCECGTNLSDALECSACKKAYQKVDHGLAPR